LVTNYNKLWKLLFDRGMKRSDLKKYLGIGSTTLAKLGKNQPVSLDVIVRICEYFNCNVGDVMDIEPDKLTTLHNAYINILKSELIPAMGCTEPGCLAFVAAKVKEVLGCVPDRCTLTVSGNLLKNTKSVIVPGTNGMKGIKAAVAAGFIACSSEDGLEALERVKPHDIPRLRIYRNTPHVLPSEGDQLLYLDASAY
jgi:DNA-binding Xre family transcriptional regulator